VRQMLKKVRITDPGDTEFIYGEAVERYRFDEANRHVEREGGKPAEASPEVEDENVR